MDTCEVIHRFICGRFPCIGLHGNLHGMTSETPEHRTDSVHALLTIHYGHPTGTLPILRSEVEARRATERPEPHAYEILDACPYLWFVPGDVVIAQPQPHGEIRIIDVLDAANSVTAIVDIPGSLPGDLLSELIFELGMAGAYVLDKNGPSLYTLWPDADSASEIKETLNDLLEDLGVAHAAEAVALSKSDRHKARTSFVDFDARWPTLKQQVLHGSVDAIRGQRWELEVIKPATAFPSRTRKDDFVLSSGLVPMVGEEAVDKQKLCDCVGPHHCGISHPGSRGVVAEQRLAG